MTYTDVLKVEVTDGSVQQDMSVQYLGTMAPPGVKVRLRMVDNNSDSTTATLTPDEALNLVENLRLAIYRAENWR